MKSYFFIEIPVYESSPRVRKNAAFLRTLRGVKYPPIVLASVGRIRRTLLLLKCTNDGRFSLSCASSVRPIVDARFEAMTRCKMKSFFHKNGTTRDRSQSLCALASEIFIVFIISRHRFVLASRFILELMAGFQLGINLARAHLASVPSRARRISHYNGRLTTSSSIGPYGGRMLRGGEKKKRQLLTHVRARYVITSVGRRRNTCDEQVAFT